MLSPAQRTPLAPTVIGGHGGGRSGRRVLAAGDRWERFCQMLKRSPDLRRGDAEFCAPCSTCLDVDHMVPPPHVTAEAIKCPECDRLVPLRRPVTAPTFSATAGMVLPVLIPTGLRGQK